MARRIDHEKRRFDSKRKMSVKDEKEFRANDLAARWLAKVEKKIDEEKNKPIATPQRIKWKGKKLKPGEPPF